jgi:hypothetical protein
MKILPLGVLLLLFNLNLSFAPELNTLTIERAEPIKKVQLKTIDWERELGRWKDSLGFYESSGNWTACNSVGCMGKYQFQQGTLEMLGYSGIEPEVFKTNPNIFPPSMQEEALKKLIRYNSNYLKKYDNYLGTEFNGIQITKSGLLAAAHLSGLGGIEDFFEENKNYKDINGTSVACYLRKFGNYNI